MDLSKLKPGETGIIQKINGENKLTKRLSALGCIEGTKVLLKAIAPFGDPIIVNFRGFDLAIRKKDAQNVIINK